MHSQSPQTVDPISPVLLSPAEALFWQVEQGATGAFRVTVLFQLEGCIKASHLTRALQRLQRRHPKLRAVIAEGSDGRLRYQFEHVAPPIPFEIRDYHEEEPLWREETSRLLQAGFAATGPLAAVSVLRSASQNRSELLLTIHHAISDGLSAIMLVHDMLTEYGNAEANIQETPCSPLPLVTPFKAKSSGGWRCKLGLFRRFLRIQRQEKRLCQTPLPEASDIAPQSQWVHWIFSREETLKLIRRCRKEQSSVSGVLLAAACSGLMDCLPLAEAVFKCQFPLNLRDELAGPSGPATAQDLGCFVSIMNQFYEVPQRPVFWDLARRAHRDVQAFRRQGGPASYYNLLGLVMAVSRRFPRGAPKVIPSNNKRVTLLATNYGVLDTSDAYGSLRPRGCTLIFRNHLVGPSLVLEGLVLGQRLNIGFAAETMEPALWEKLHVAVRKHLDAAASA